MHRCSFKIKIASRLPQLDIGGVAIPTFKQSSKGILCTIYVVGEVEFNKYFCYALTSRIQVILIDVNVKLSRIAEYQSVLIVFEIILTRKPVGLMFTILQ